MTDEEIYDNLSKEEKDAMQFFDLVEGDNSNTDFSFNKNHGIFGLLFHNKLNLDFKGIRRFIFIGFGVLTLNGILLTAAK